MLLFTDLFGLRGRLEGPGGRRMAGRSRLRRLCRSPCGRTSWPWLVGLRKVWVRDDSWAIDGQEVEKGGDRRREAGEGSLGKFRGARNFGGGAVGGSASDVRKFENWPACRAVGWQQCSPPSASGPPKRKVDA